jgi:hypothetical protein
VGSVSQGLGPNNGPAGPSPSPSDVLTGDTGVVFEVEAVDALAPDAAVAAALVEVLGAEVVAGADTVTPDGCRADAVKSAAKSAAAWDVVFAGVATGVTP